MRVSTNQSIRINLIVCLLTTLAFITLIPMAYAGSPAVIVRYDDCSRAPVICERIRRGLLACHRPCKPVSPLDDTPIEKSCGPYPQTALDNCNEASINHACHAVCDHDTWTWIISQGN